MKEEFLHFIWKNRLFDNDSLFTTGGESVSVDDPGTYNYDSGPDFFNSRITIGDTLWAGNVEIHLLASQWNSHGHQDDHAYDNVILHVVAEHDEDVITAGGTKPDTMVIRWDDSIYTLYDEFLRKPYIIACRDYIGHVDPFFIRHSIHSLAVERLKEKSKQVKPVLEDTGNDWEETLYRLIAMYFGMNVNADPFYRLATNLPLKILRKHLDNPLQVEALMFGEAGFLDRGLFPGAAGEDYFNDLCREFGVLGSKYNLKPLDGWLWKFNRMRPANFPTIRISQFSSLIVNSDPLFSKIRDSVTTDGLRSLLKADITSYWLNHYTFARESPVRHKTIGRSMSDILIINTIVPLLFMYGKMHNQEMYCDRAIDLADSLPPENNRIIREWTIFGVVPLSAFESQGLIELRKRFCKIRNCLNCSIGTKLISLGKEIETGKNPFLGEPFVT